MLVCYLDDSGEASEPIVTLAGYVGDTVRWAEFETAARSYMDAHGIEYLHTVDLNHRRGAFKGWSSDRTLAFAQGLFEILGQRVCLGYEFSVHKEPFNHGKRLHNLKREGAPTTFCFKGLLNRLRSDVAVCKFLEFEGTDLSFVVEAGNAHNNAIKNEFDRMKRFDGRLGELRFAGKKDFVALQVADFLAYFSRRLRCMDNAASEREAQHSFFITATAPVKVHVQFLATDFHVD